MTTHDMMVQWLLANRPGSQWNLSGDTYDGLVWLDDPSTKPTANDMGL